jgi:hypothetical protein
MGGTASFIKDVGKGIVKGTISAAGSFVPVLGKPVADAINSRFATGGNVGDTKVPEGYKAKTINTVSQLEGLVKKYPDIAKKHNLSVDTIREHVEKAKEDKAKPKEETPKMAVGAKSVEKKSKKPRSAAQIAATAKLVALNKKKK